MALRIAFVSRKLKHSFKLSRKLLACNQFCTTKCFYSTANESKISTADYIQPRLELWNHLKKQYDEELLHKPRIPIKVKLSNGKTIDGLSWQTTPFDVVQAISQHDAESAIVATVNNKLWDLDRPIETDCVLKFLKITDLEGQEVFWHSTAHVLGQALENIYGGVLRYGPPTKNGFYYDIFCNQNSISSNDFPEIENQMKQIVKERQRFERIEVSKEHLLEMFSYNKFKLFVLNELVQTEKTTVYRCGTLIDLCLGPHIRHTGRIKAFKVISKGAVQHNDDTLDRIYGISFPTDKELRAWEKFQEEAAKKNHRKIGEDQKLFFFHELSPGSAFFEPHGTHIYNNLVDFIRAEYRKRGFHEVITPNIYNSKLWQTSGHWEHFSENMYSFETAKDTFALKPMNCPGHCLIFDHGVRSWRELPIRMADFGVLHRNEINHSGLTRVRRFQQDDAHIFCTTEQIRDEIDSCLDFLSQIYKTFGFSVQLVLSTRPEHFMGELEIWDKAEKDLENALNKFGQPWKLNPGDGAFYGPKIDVTITDALNRAHQCGTIQLDFQLPIRFNLRYQTETGEEKHPVIIHRAILGSVERQIAILAENYEGKWPFWLSPRQIMVVPIDPVFNDYAESVCKQLFDIGFQAEVDLTEGHTFNKKVRNGQLAQFNFILVVGQKERDNNTVNVRTRNNKVHGEFKIDDLVAKFKRLRDEKTVGDSIL